MPVWRLFPNRLPLSCRIFNQTDPLPVWHSASDATRLCAASLILAVAVLVGYMIRRGSECTSADAIMSAHGTKRTSAMVRCHVSN